MPYQSHAGGDGEEGWVLSDVSRTDRTPEDCMDHRAALTSGECAGEALFKGRLTVMMKLNPACFLCSSIDCWSVLKIELVSASAWPFTGYAQLQIIV